MAMLYVALLIPEATPPTPAGAGKQPFVWNQDRVWSDLERQFLAGRTMERSVLDQRMDELFANAERRVRELAATPLPPGHPTFRALETNLFTLAPLVAASTQRLPEFVSLVTDTRRQTKKQSERWDLQSDRVREQLYRLLFGGRMALEEVLLQLPRAVAISPECDQEPSKTPATQIFGVTLHSGDILVSRGSKPTSSLIARGNDYPGSFSHAALLYVDERTGKASVVEALIERGLVVTPLEQYVQGTRLRLMALRPRADLTAVVDDPQLPHEVAAAACQQARQRHTPYDFAMDHRDHRALFCSEVVATAYARVGIRLWMGMSFISSPAVTAWLGSLGVRHFETQEPADLEYDPQLRVVAEWRDPAALFQAHLDDAATDVLLSKATPGQPLPYSRLKLPLARLAKAGSVALNALGREGPIPEGMSATSALRVSQFNAAHQRTKRQLVALAAEFQNQHHYVPPYWELIRLARSAAEGNPP
jgi:hypothetical protein